MRLISSQSLQPTSPIQSSFVPGRIVDAERVAQPVGDDPPRVRRRRSPTSGLPGSAAPGVGIDAEDRAVERDRVAARAEVLGAQRAALGRRRRLRAADAAGRVAARVEPGSPSWP